MTDDAILTHRVMETEAGQRLDALSASVFSITRSAAQKAIEEGNITLNSAPINKKSKGKAGDLLSYLPPDPTLAEILPEDIPLDVVYEDADIIIINKPVGMVVHPAPGNPSGTLVNALLHHCGSSLSGIGGVIRPGIVHRIDKDTGGLLAVAKNDAAHLFLSEQLKDHTLGRIYTAIALGNFKEDSGTIDAPIGRHPVDRKRMAVIRDPSLGVREAVTHWQVLARGSAEGNAFTLLRCRLKTGRTHQIRVHCASVGHPLLGDPIYGGNGSRFEAKHKRLIEGQCLHAGELHLIHPRTKKEMHFFAPLPSDMQKLIHILFENQ